MRSEGFTGFTADALKHAEQRARQKKEALSAKFNELREEHAAVSREAAEGDGQDHLTDEQSQNLKLKRRSRVKKSQAVVSAIEAVKQKYFVNAQHERAASLLYEHEVLSQEAGRLELERSREIQQQMMAEIERLQHKCILVEGERDHVQNLYSSFLASTRIPRSLIRFHDSVEKYAAVKHYFDRHRRKLLAQAIRPWDQVIGLEEARRVHPSARESFE